LLPADAIIASAIDIFIITILRISFHADISPPLRHFRHYAIISLIFSIDALLLR
jgi:hypothetical protein